MIRKIGLLLLAIIAATLLFFYFDPAFERELRFKQFAVPYEFRIFDNMRCNLASRGHCITNELSLAGAENQLYLNMINNYKGDTVLADKLMHTVATTYRYHMTYTYLTSSSEVHIDSIYKYKEFLFGTIYID